MSTASSGPDPTLDPIFQPASAVATPEAAVPVGSAPRALPGSGIWRLARLVAWARFLLIIPIIAAYQRRAQRSLSWRLVGSHLATVFLSIFGIAAISAACTLLVAWVQDPFSIESAQEAKVIADVIVDSGQANRIWSGDLNPLLTAFQTGSIGHNTLDEDVNLFATIGRAFANITSVSIVRPDGTVIASSDPRLIGQPGSSIGEAAALAIQPALAGGVDLRRNTIRLSDDVGTAGAYPIVIGEGRNVLVGAVIVAKSEPTYPSSFLGIVLLSLTFVAIVGLTIAVLVGVPAIPIATMVGIRRGRAVSKPAKDLARAAERVAAGDLAVRVWVPGQDEIARLARAFNRMADQLQQSIALEADARARAEKALAANRDLVANVSHELRTPVALIRGHIEALTDDPSHHEAYTGIALRETDRLEDLVNDLFQLARVDAQGIHLIIEPFEAAAAVREAVESLAEPARRDAGITMLAEVDADATATICRGDRGRLVQVLQNLIRNAIRYTPEGGIILVSAHGNSARGTVSVSVRDTGNGIPPEDLPHIFDRFYRGDHSRNRSSGGAGLGLSIAKQFIEAMGGAIEAESELDEGTVFTIHLPAHAVDMVGASDLRGEDVSVA